MPRAVQAEVDLAGFSLVCEDCSRETQKPRLLKTRPGRYVCPKCANVGIRAGRYFVCTSCGELTPAARRSRLRFYVCDGCPQK